MDGEVDLYALDADGVEMKACGGNLQSGMESCVSYAPLPGVGDGFVVGDTKPESGGVTLRYSGDELDAFARRWMRDRGLTA
jgi:hypothetical protein